MSFRRFVYVLPLVLLAACSGTPGEDPAVPKPTTSATASVAPTTSATAVATVTPKAPPRADTTLVKRQVLFGNPDRAGLQLSPKGDRLAFLAPKDGVLNVWVGPADKPADAKVVTAEKERGIRRYFWDATGEHILYAQDTKGDENFHVYAVDLKAGSTRDLTPYKEIQARVELVSPKIKDEILIGMNDRDKKYHDLYRVSLKTGDRKLVRKNEGYTEFVADYDFNVRYALLAGKDGSDEIYKTGKEAKDDKVFTKIPYEDSLTTGLTGFDLAGKTLYMLDSRGRDTTALVTIDEKTAAPRVLAEDAKSDIQGLVTNPKDKKPQAVHSSHERKSWKVLDKALEKDFEALKKVTDGDFDIVSRSDDDKRWVVAYVVSDGPVRYYLYDHAKRKADFLFTNLAALENVKLTKMHPRVIKSRDGLDLVSYLSLPAESDADGDGKPNKVLPMVLLVHGGPWARDTWGLNPMHQWLASRGYAVLSVNFRGSTGFGKKFVNAANKEWAGKMHNDLLDAVDWAVSTAITDKSQVAIMGGSYGGYSTLVGLTFTPDTFACGVDIVGPSNLVTLLSSIPPYWASFLEQFAARVGDHRTEEGKKFLLSRSPLTFVDKIKKPLLIGQGANDPRVKQAESDMIVQAMTQKSIPVTYVLYPDEGHGFNRPQNRTSFYAVAETFLAQCLGGPYEPVGDDFKGSSITVPKGADQIHGIEGALKSQAQ